MRVGLLASLLSRSAGYRRAGVSRYIEALLQYLPTVAPDLEIVAWLPRTVWRAGQAEFPSAIIWRPTRWPTERPLARIAWEQAIAPVATVGCSLVHGPVNVLPLARWVPGVVTVHDLAFLHFPETYPVAKRWYLHFFTRWSVARADRVITVSEHTGRDVVASLGVPPERVVIVPNGVDATFRRIEDERALATWRAERELPERFLLYVGTLQPRKNLTTLLEAMAHLGSAFDWLLVVVGARGWKESGIFARLRELGLERRVRFVGYVPPEELRWWYSAATVFVYPSLYEGFGLPVLEAMACGTPVITSDGSALREVARDAAVLVDPRDPSALARAIAELASDEERRRALAMAGLVRARSYTWERTARETAAVYRAVAEEAHRRRTNRGGEG